jgi:hypothetical protein
MQGPGRCAIWDINARAFKMPLAGHTARITDLAVTADR